MSKTSTKAKLETLQGWISWVSRQKGYPKQKTKVKKDLEY
jgi:hypothetical protein